MPKSVTRVLLSISFAAMASNTAIACGGVDSLDARRSRTNTDASVAEAAPRLDEAPPSIEAGLVEQAPIPQDAGADPVAATCQPSCLPVDWLADVLRNAGLDVWEDPNWKTNGHGSFQDLWGIVVHHTGVDSDTEWQVIRDGRSDLPGPLSQLVLEKDGLFRVVASGVAWHAGAGSYPGLDDDEANWHTLGIEAVNTGTEGWSAAQYTAYVRGVAAILKYLALDASHVIGHKEWAGAVQGKWDPGKMDMATFRADVQSFIDK